MSVINICHLVLVIDTNDEEVTDFSWILAGVFELNFPEDECLAVHP